MDKTDIIPIISVAWLCMSVILFCLDIYTNIIGPTFLLWMFIIHCTDFFPKKEEFIDKRGFNNRVNRYEILAVVTLFLILFILCIVFKLIFS